MRPHNATPPEILDRAEKMLKEGMSYRTVGSMVGVKHSTLIRRLPGYGMTKSEGCMVGQVNRKLREMTRHGRLAE